MSTTTRDLAPVAARPTPIATLKSAGGFLRKLLSIGGGGSANGPCWRKWMNGRSAIWASPPPM